MATVGRGRRDRTLLSVIGYTVLDHNDAEGASAKQWFFGAPTADLTLVNPAAFDHAQTGIVLTGSLFGASQGAGLVELGDASDYTTATKATQTVTAWADTSITITANLGALTPGPLWMFVTNNAGQHSEGRPVLVHRAAAFVFSPTANISAGGADTTTARLTAPAGKTTANHDPGRRVDDSATTPATTTTASDYVEHEWAIEATAAAVVGQVYEFRVIRSDGIVLGTTSVTPQWTISAGGGDATVAPAAIAAVATVPAPTESVGAAPVTVAGVVAMPAPSALTGTTTTPATVTAAVTAPQPAVSIGAAPVAVAAVLATPQPAASVGAAPATVAAVVTVPTPTAGQTGGGSATATPGAVASVATVPQSAVSVGAAPAVVSATSTVPAPTAITGTTATPAAVAAVVALPASTESVGAAANTITVPVAMPAPTVFTGAGAAPSTITAAAAVNQPAVSVGAAPPALVLAVLVYSPSTGALLWSWYLRRSGAWLPASAKLDGVHPTSTDVT